MGPYILPPSSYTPLGGEIKVEQSSLPIKTMPEEIANEESANDETQPLLHPGPTPDTAPGSTKTENVLNSIQFGSTKFVLALIGKEWILDDA